MTYDVSDRHEELGGTHHGRIPEAPPRPGIRDDAPRARRTIRLVLDRHQVRKVLDGEKTRHARLWRRDDPEEGPVQPGDRIPVQKVAGGTICHVVVTQVMLRELAEELDLAEARRRGYRSTDAYKRAWLATNDPKCKRAGLDAVLAMTEEEIAELWAPHSDCSVWLIEFGLDTVEDLRWIRAGIIDETTASPASDAARGYTRNPAQAAEPDAPSPDNAALEIYAYDGERRHQERKREETAEEMARRTSREDNLVERFTQTVAIARALGVDPHSQIRLIGRGLTQLEQAIRAKQVEAERGRLA